MVVAIKVVETYLHCSFIMESYCNRRLEANGFLFSEALTAQVRREARLEKEAAGGEVGTHIALTMQVFLNPAIAGLPDHQHVFAGHGCFNGLGVDRESFFNNGGGAPCTGADELPPQFESLLNCRRTIEKGKSPGLWDCVRNPKAFSQESLMIPISPKD